MTTQHPPARTDGSALFHFNAGAFAFEVLEHPGRTGALLQLLADSADAGVGTIRLGRFGPYEVRVTRGTDDWRCAWMSARPSAMAVIRQVNASAPTSAGWCC